ncbi:MAG: 2-oxoacid:acceptor oxidoreductase family protein [Anaerolineales bacterium]|jgi:2-oxoglutarate ferredoxin oxidoreductase subunit gamma|nr:2-oxoacid:acceptor oxidoreductase family protein [Anaerolineales bacterium]
MHQSFVFSGFGGQGALFAGQVLTYAAMDTGRHVTWIPSYGPEMRGGVARCTVIVSDEEIGSPIVRNPDVAVVFNNPSLERFQTEIRSGGLMVVNSSMINVPAERSDIRVLQIAGGEIAIELGDVRMTNMVLLGAMLAANSIVELSAAEQALRDHLPERKQHLVEPNIEVLRRGYRTATKE